jgi:glycosyltransferase involved in cell wall biosynthesis
MTQRAILVCRSFAPLNSVASIRFSKFAKYLLNKGWQVTVFTSDIKPGSVIDPGLVDLNSENLTVIRSKHVMSSGDKKRQARKGLQAPRTRNPLVSSLIRILLIFKRLYNDWSVDFSFYYHTRKAIQAYSAPLEADLILSTYRPIACHAAAGYLKQKKGLKKAVWIADFRDIPLDYSELPYWLRNVILKLYAGFIRKADGACFVSQGMHDRFHTNPLGRNFQGSTRVLHSGYDGEDIAEYRQRAPESACFKIAYTGIMRDMRDASMLFEAIHNLQARQAVGDDIQVDFAGRSSDYDKLYKQAQRYGMQDMIVNNGYVPHQQALSIQASSDVLLSLSWHTKQESGWLTGKFVEYIGMQRPIIALIAGDLTGSEVSELMARFELGQSFYYCSRAEDLERLERYLLELYQHKKAHGSQQLVPNPARSQFDYEHLTQQLIEFQRSIAVQ